MFLIVFGQQWEGYGTEEKAASGFGYKDNTCEQDTFNVGFVFFMRFVGNKKNTEYHHTSPLYWAIIEFYKLFLNDLIPQFVVTYQLCLCISWALADANVKPASHSGFCVAMKVVNQHTGAHQLT